MSNMKTPEQRVAEDLGGMSNPMENKTAPVIDQSEKNGAHVVEIPLLLPEVSELSVQRGYPYNRKDAVYKVVEISQEKVDEIENYINTTTTPEVKKKFKVILKLLQTKSVLVQGELAKLFRGNLSMQEFLRC